MTDLKHLYPGACDDTGSHAKNSRESCAIRREKGERKARLMTWKGNFIHYVILLEAGALSSL